MKNKWSKINLSDVVDDFVVPMRDKPKHFSGSTPWCRIEDFNGIYLSGSKSGQYVDKKTIQDMKLRVYPINTVLVSCSADLGRCAITTKPLITNQTFIGLVPSKKVDSLFLYYLMSFNAGRLNNLSSGTTISYLSRKQFENLSVSVPLDISNQQKIAKILLTVDDAIQKTDQIIQKTEKLKQGLMNELLTKGIGHKKFKKTKLGEIPEEWEVLTMKDICTVRQGLQIAIKQRKNLPGDNRHVYITNKYLKDLEKPEYIEDPLKSVVCNENDILMTRTGNTGLVVTNVKGVFHNNFFLIDFDRNRLIKDFLVFYLQKPDIQKMILDRAGTTTIPDLNHGDFYSLPLVIPNKEEQKVISEIITFISKKIMSEQQAFEGLKKLKRSLMQDIFSQKVEIS